MPHFPIENDPTLWHKYFAMECNNRAWDLATRPRTPDEDREMLNTAHASALHWDAMGVELNNMRAQMLVAEVHALVGYGESAFSYAEEMRNYFLGIESPDWEIAFAHTIYAHAAQVKGDTAAHESAYKEAVKALDDIKDDQDREIVQKTFDQVSAP